MRLLLGRDDLADAVTAAVRHADPTLELERLEAHPVHRGFPAFVNDGAVDVSEVALITLLQALAAGRPLGLLPVTVLGRFQHHTLVTCTGLRTGSLAGSRIGIRSWTQTTGVWVRGALAEQYGIDLRGIDWVTYEDGHVSGCPDPGWVRRAAAGAELVSDLTEGRLDAAIIGNDLPEGTPARPVLDDPAGAARHWVQMTGCIPVNHVVAIRLSLLRERPDLARAVYAALRAATAADAMSPSGFTALSGVLIKAAAYAREQGILTRAMSLEEIIAPTREVLDDGGS